MEFLWPVDYGTFTEGFDVLAVLEFQIRCLRAETPPMYPRSFLINHEGHEQKLGRSLRL